MATSQEIADTLREPTTSRVNGHQLVTPLTGELVQESANGDLMVCVATDRLGWVQWIDIQVGDEVDYVFADGATDATWNEGFME